MISLHIRHALPKSVFNPEILEGCDVISAYPQTDTSFLGTDVMVKQSDGTPVYGKVSCAYGSIRLQQNSHLIFREALTVQLDTPFETGFTTPQSRIIFKADGSDSIIGVAISPFKNPSTILMASADSVLHPRYLHVREALRNKFDQSALRGRAIADSSNLHQAWVHVSGHPEKRAWVRPHSRLQDVGINGVIYRDALLVRSVAGRSKSSFAPGHFASPSDVGKMVLLSDPERKAAHKREAVVGVIAGIADQESNYDVARMTVIAPAESFLESFDL